MYEKNPLAKAISAITLASALAATGFPTAVLAQSDDAIEEVIVTGSRIQRAVADTPRPVSVIDRVDIELSGMESVADTLRSTSFNSFGSYRERSGSSFGQIALIDLRGLGADRTAVLINGRRVPGNPLTGGSAVDLNSIPLSAVKQVEVLTDSASAVYGADAIGGVVNIIMRDDFEGAEFEIGGNFPSRDGGDSDHFNFTFGAQGDRSSILFTGEWYRRQPIFDADRDYSRVQVNPNPNGGSPRLDVDTVGVSGGGNTGFATDFSEAFLVSPTCPTDLYVPISEPFGIPGEGCGYGFADRSMLTGGLDRQSTFVTASYDINDDNEIYIENRYSRIESFGRYAPAVGFFGVGADNPNNPRGDAALGDGNGEDIFLFHRFVGHGDRDDSTTTNELDTIIGFRGTLMGGVSYDVNARHYQYLAQNEGDTYVLTSVIEDLVAAGEYNFADPLSQDATHQNAIAMSAATLFRDISTDVTAFEASLTGSAFPLPAGEVGWAAGVESFKEDYQDQYDSFREAGNVLGSSGNSAEGGRSRWAAFVETEVPILDNLSMNVAVRYDDYDDFGTETSPSIAFRYAPIEMVKLRASYGEGFKAPNLSSIHSQLSQSFNFGQDLVACGGVAEGCPRVQYENYTGGNPDLAAETAESYNFGIIVDPMDNLTLSVDWFSVDIEDAIATLSVQQVFQLEFDGELPDGVVVNRGPTGQLINCAGGLQPPNCGIVKPFANVATEEVSGFDVRAQYDLDTDVGRFTSILELSKITKYDYQVTESSPLIDRIDERAGYPDTRYNMTLRWAMDAWTVNYIYRHIGTHSDDSTDAKYDDYATMDINVSWSTPWGGELSFGALNFTDEDPEFNQTTGQFESSLALPLYDVTGRVPFASYKHFF